MTKANELPREDLLIRDKFRESIKLETLKKAAEKYPEPFNPEKWTTEELARHAMAENYDQSNYIYGMYERMQQLEKERDKYKGLFEGYKRLYFMACKNRENEGR